MLVILDIQSNIHLILKIASDFEFLPVDVNLARCQRYYVKKTFWAAGLADSPGNVVLFAVSVPVEMRSQPSVTNDADTSGIGANGGLFNVNASSAAIVNGWWNGFNGAILITTNTQITQYTVAWGRVGINLQLNSEL